MYVDIPEIERCCCCIPARYGLLIWTYIRLVFSMILTPPILLLNMLLLRYLGTERVLLPCLAVLAAIVILLDIAMHIIALVGGHTKRLKLLHLYYKYSIFFLVLFSVLFALFVVMDLEAASGYYIESEKIVWSYAAWFTVVGFGSLFVQIYMLLLLRSIIKKLGSSCKFRFVNHAAEAEIECIFDNNVKDDEESVGDDNEENIHVNDITEENENKLKGEDDSTKDCSQIEDNANANEIFYLV